ncbi:MAG: hypothetical protein ACRDNP_13090, partial [Gaiellaceae bacterium]
AVAATSAFATRALLLDKGFIGLPPEGATPSTPENGELVLHYFGPNPGQHGKSRVWVYADGRVISLRDAPVPVGANEWSTGFLEQRLSPEGVERLRSEVASSTGVGQPPPNAAPLPFYTLIEVRDGDQLVPVEWASDQARLESRLSDPASWLPTGAWQHVEYRAYVPSRFAVCSGGWPPDQPIERSRLLSLLPAVAQDLLRDSERREGPLFGSPGNFHPSYEYCADAKAEDARTLAETLDDSGPSKRGGALRLNWRFEATGASRETAHIWFEPYLPHGDFTCSVCG